MTYSAEDEAHKIASCVRGCATDQQYTELVEGVTKLTAVVGAAQRYLNAQLLIGRRTFLPPDAWARFADAEDALRDALKDTP